MCAVDVCMCHEQTHNLLLACRKVWMVDFMHVTAAIAHHLNLLEVRIPGRTTAK